MSTAGKTFYEQVQKIDDENRIEKIYTSSHLKNDVRVALEDRHISGEISWFQGKYHVFVQDDGTNFRDSIVKLRSHYTSTDLITWKYEGSALYPASLSAEESYVSHLKLKHKKIIKFYRTA